MCRGGGVWHYHQALTFFRGWMWWPHFLLCWVFLLTWTRRWFRRYTNFSLSALFVPMCPPPPNSLLGLLCASRLFRLRFFPFPHYWISCREKGEEGVRGYTAGHQNSCSLLCSTASKPSCLLLLPLRGCMLKQSRLLPASQAPVLHVAPSLFLLSLFWLFKSACCQCFVVCQNASPFFPHF